MDAARRPGVERAARIRVGSFPRPVPVSVDSVVVQPDSRRRSARTPLVAEVWCVEVGSLVTP